MVGIEIDQDSNECSKHEDDVENIAQLQQVEITSHNIIIIYYKEKPEP